jgi:3-hydroxyacyl-[acyl-carrier-protein] dehydratase
MSDSKIIQSFDLCGIKDCQQNRYPILFVDKISEVVPGDYAIGHKNFSYNEWYFPSHYEDDPNVPGFIQVEALVQVFLMTFLTMPQYKGMKTSFVSIDRVKFRKKIIPGDRLDIKASLKSFKRGLAVGSVVSSVNGIDAASAEFVVCIPEILDAFKPDVVEVNGQK